MQETTQPPGQVPGTAPGVESLDPTKLQRLHEIVDELGSVAVAFSAGIDSTLVLKVAYDRLGDRAVGVIGKSASLPPGELDEARQLARFIGADLVELETHEFEQEAYVTNPENRCYFCKTELYKHVRPYAKANNFAAIADGLNVDDIGDYRPGAKASDEAHVRHPLQEAGFTKNDIRCLARQLGLPNWNKPALACLSSRIPYGIRIQPEMLDDVGRAEWKLREMGFGSTRVRYHESVARIEVPEQEFARVLEHRVAIVEAVKQAGFKFVTLDLEGYRMGSLNQLRRNPSS